MLTNDRGWGRRGLKGWNLMDNVGIQNYALKMIKGYPGTQRHVVEGADIPVSDSLFLRLRSYYE